MRTAAVVGTVLLGVALALATACDEERVTCYAGDYADCTCADGRRGYRACVSDSTYGACVCDGTTPGLDGSFEDADDADADAGPPPKLPFMSTCTTDDECESGQCHLFTQSGSFCTKDCKTTADCPPPSAGCNNRGICKAP